MKPCGCAHGERTLPAQNVVDKLRDGSVYAEALAERHSLGPLSSRAVVGKDYVYTFERGVVRRLGSGELRVESLP